MASPPPGSPDFVPRPSDESTSTEPLRAESGAPPKPGVLIDVHFPGPLGHSAGQTFAIFMLVVIPSGACAVAAATLLPASALAAKVAIPLALCVAVFASLFSVGSMLRARNKRRGQAIACTVARDGAGPALAALCQTVRGWAAEHGCISALRTLLYLGHQGLTLRIGKSEEARPVVPLAWPIEPQPLDEAYTSLLDDPAGPQRTTPGLGASDLARVIRRNVRRKGGWWLIAIFVPVWAIQVAQSLSQKRITLPAVLWTAALVAALFVGPIRGRAAEQWFIVPGGMVRRKASPFQKRWSLHLFERSKSVLCAVRWFGQSWLILVQDGHETARRNATRDEVTLLLRAWLSPLPPPPVERLSDLD